MRQRSTDAEIQRLRSIARSGDTAGLAVCLESLIKTDSEKWLKILREQKLISQLRSAQRIRELRQLCFVRGSRLCASEMQSRKLAHHLDVCEFFQEVFETIDRETLALPATAAHPALVARGVLRVIEVASYAYQRNAMVRASGGQRVTALEVSQAERGFRNVLDAGNTILRRLRSWSGSDEAYPLPDGEIEDLFRLALLYDDVRQGFDAYSFLGASVRINRRSLVVGRASRDMAQAAAVGGERTAGYDQMRFAHLHGFEVRMHSQCQSALEGTSDEFLVFLQKVARNSEAYASVRAFGEAVAADIRYELTGLLDPTSAVTTSAGSFTIDELTRAWAFLTVLAALAQEWSSARADVLAPTEATRSGSQRQRTITVRSLPVAEIGSGMLTAILAREMHVSRRQAGALISQFTSTLSDPQTDMFYRPLVMVGSNRLLLPASYIRKSRFDRNLFVIETGLNQKTKGRLPVESLNRHFRSAGFRSLTNFRVRIDGVEITDIDLIAFKDGVLFLGQCKVVIEPDSFYEHWKAEQKIQAAARQLDACLKHLDRFRARLFKTLGVTQVTEDRLVPFIVTNTCQFTERRYRGHPVVDLRYLEFVLSGARRSLVRASTEGISVASGRSYIKGGRPTSEELADLLVNTFHNVGRREMTRSYVRRKVGKLNLHLPTVSLRTPGDSYLRISDE